MARKIVIEYKTLNGNWQPAYARSFLACVVNVINRLGTGECPEVHRHLDALFAANAEACEQTQPAYRWRYAEPEGRKAKRGDYVRGKSSTKYVIIGFDKEHDVFKAVLVSGTCAGHEMHLASDDIALVDGAPVTGYDPS